MEPAGFLAGLFRSFQGEGPWIGCPQFFLRLAGCSLGCPWCDTREAWTAPAEIACGGGQRLANPVSAGALAALLDRLVPPPRLPLALTGGEPLEQAGFLEALLPRLSGLGFVIHLETAGVHAGALAGLLGHLAHVSMDWKLPSLGGPDRRPAHLEFLDVLGAWGGDQAVKVVVGPTTAFPEAAEAASEVARRSPGATLVLQPLGQPPSGRPSPESLAAAAALAVGLQPLHPRLRVLPQLHRLLGWA